MTSLSNFFGVALFLLSSLVTGPSFMWISSLVLELWQFSFIRDWPEIGNTTVRVLPNIWRLRRVRDTKFNPSFFDEMLLNAAKCQGYSFYRFWVIKGKPTGGKITPTQIRVKALETIQTSFLWYNTNSKTKHKTIGKNFGEEDLNKALWRLLSRVENHFFVPAKVGVQSFI